MKVVVCGKRMLLLIGEKVSNKTAVLLLRCERVVFVLLCCSVSVLQILLHVQSL